ncbi:MAG: response regulator [Desulfuromonadaceae bacterium]
MQQAQQKILLVDDEDGIRFTLGTLLKKEGYLVDVAADLSAARSFLQDSRYDLVFSDIMLEGESGLDLLREIKGSAQDAQVVMFTGSPQVESAAEAVRLGAFDYIYQAGALRNAYCRHTARPGYEGAQ